jgi:CBS domain-containing protein
MKVHEAMHSGVEWLGPSASLAEIAETMRKHDVGAIPIGENDRLIGMVTDRDIVLKAFAKKADPSKLTARDVMTKGIVYCQENEELGDALEVMESKKIRRLPVLSKAKRMIGMLSLGDVAHKASHSLTGELTAAVAGHHTN